MEVFPHKLVSWKSAAWILGTIGAFLGTALGLASSSLLSTQMKDNIAIFLFGLCVVFAFLLAFVLYQLARDVYMHRKKRKLIEKILLLQAQSKRREDKIREIAREEIKKYHAPSAFVRALRASNKEKGEDNG